MKLVNGYDIMDYARKYGYVLPAFNTTNLEMTYAIAEGLMCADPPGYIRFRQIICAFPVRRLLR